MNVCFVCFGNVCRSPTAEIIFFELVKEAGLSESIRVTSAGVAAVSGQPLDQGSAATLRRHGYRHLAHSARRFGPHWFDNCDLIMVSDAEVAQHVLDSARTDEERQRVRLLAPDGVPNPWGGDRTAYESAYDSIDRACRELLRSLRPDAAPGALGQA
ncbi:low molecular weight protein-tyrosine-phosphatase [Microbacterium sp. TNHR37B]|uniref:low molecular weight protein-tyrosine-phosphatase n=1 Tax=Microbacterium sp. TNHR37B TaxID=1775956 RepID=UPI0007B1F18A|nr:Low molecular weight protein-tyrosine-phosphatase YfkJ [Microbacterium sp. TNHR37B]